MTAVNNTVAKLTRHAMDKYRLTAPNLAKAIGCGTKSVYQILDGVETRLTQEQYFNLFILAGMKIGGKKDELQRKEA